MSKNTFTPKDLGKKITISRPEYGDQAFLVTVTRINEDGTCSAQFGNDQFAHRIRKSDIVKTA